MTGQLTKKDHDLLDEFLEHVLTQFKDGEIEKSEAIGNIAHLVAAVDRGPGEGDNPSKYMKAVMQGDD